MPTTYKENISLAYTLGEIRAILDQEVGVKTFTLQVMVNDLTGMFRDKLDVPQLVALGKSYQLGYTATVQDDIAPKDTVRLEDI